MRAETKTILKESFSEKDGKIFNEFSIIIGEKYKDKEAHRKIWEYDKRIGGFGGYAAPLDPVINPFNRLGDFRNVFRSLQYARSDMFYCCRARHIIIDASLHIETLVKIILSKNKLFKYKYNKRELGKNIEQLYTEKTIDERLYKRLNNIKALLNYAKHDTDPENNNTFDYKDAIVFYFEIRKIGNQLLKIINYPTCNKYYEINEDEQ